MTDTHTESFNSFNSFNTGLCEFLARSVTPFHAVAEMTRRLQAAGFEVVTDDKPWSLKAGGRYYITRNGSSIIAFTVGTETAPAQGLRMVGAHTDSPCLMVKPTPELASKGYFQLGVQVYGGALLNPWFDRDLSLAGRVSYEDAGGALRNALIDYRDAIATIPSLAIHLDREVNQNRSINPQTDIVPVLCQLQGKDKRDFRQMLREQLLKEQPDLDVAQVLDFELCFYDTQPPAVIGLEREFLASARLDNLLSCYVGLQALLESDGSHSALLVCNDHEEVGSLSAIGAQGPFLKSVLRRMAPAGEGDYAAMIDRSMMISADNAHGVHPNFADKHDNNHGPLLNAGPVLKINANQRYASNSETTALFRQLAAAQGVPVQSFVVRADMACGSTIGPITAGELGVRTLDIGVPTFGMHSPRELAGSQDAANLQGILARYFNHPGPLSAR